MKITTLIENETNREDLDYEHGLSILIEVDGEKILFDLGQSGNFINNAKKLDVDLKDLNYLVISHGHYDHSGGFERLMKEINPNIKLYIGKGFFNKKYRLIEDWDYEYLGNPFDEEFVKEKQVPISYLSEDMINITESLLIFTNFNRDPQFQNTNEDMYVKENGEYKKDLFLDEVSLGIKTNKGLVILVGCSHVGIVNILDTIMERTGMEIYALIGGTHLVKEDDEQINKIIDYLGEKEIKIIGACHCTGKQGKTMMSQQLEDRFINNNTGDVFKV